MKNVRRMLMISAIVALGTTFSLDFFMEGFIITLSIILLPLLLFAYEPLEPMATCLFVSVISPGFRMVLTYLATHNIGYAFIREVPSSAFYVVYGIVFSLGYGYTGKRNITRLIITVLLADFLSNLAEVCIRSSIVGLEFQVVKALLLIALLRTLIVAVGVIALKTYRSFLSREEHEARYRRLLMLMSSYKSEIYFMNMNMKNIESIMGKSFRAYRIAEETGAADELRVLALDISKDVHEIKKDYIRVIKGLEDMSETRMELKPMNIQDLVSLLLDSLRETAEPGHLAVDVVSKIETEFRVGEHFYLMSVMRNLVVNALEACEGKPDARVELAVAEVEDFLTISVKDNGYGIRITDLDYIFNPGFSTKYDPESGNMSRGLGLTLVKEMVEMHFGGTISVGSVYGNHTVFNVSIPKVKLEGNPA